MSLLTGGELAVLALKKAGINELFGLVGNHVSPMFVHCEKHNLEIIDVRHEQAAVHMADGYAQATRRTAVAVVVGGPGFPNAVMGIIKAHMANTPVLIITGASVPQQKDDGGLQDLDQISIIRQYTRWSATVYDPKRIPAYISMGLKKTMTGRPGPVVLEIPISMFKAVVSDVDVEWGEVCELIEPAAQAESLSGIIDLLGQSKKPVALIGDEAYFSKADKETIAFIEAAGIPALTVNKVRGMVPDCHPLCFGNGRVLEAGPQLYALKNADLVLVIGLDLDYQLGFGKEPFFRSGQKFIHIRKNQADLVGANRRMDIGISGNIKNTLILLRSLLEKKKLPDYSVWIKECRANFHAYWDALFQPVRMDQTPIHPIRLIEDMKKTVGKDAMFVIDGSNSMFWGSLLVEATAPGQVTIGPDGTLGAMGTGVSLAIAVKKANPDKVVVLYTGDGSFGFNAIEMDTAIRLKLPVIVIVHNDACWGFCKSTQKVLYDNTAAADLAPTRYDRMVAGLGGHGEFVEKPEEIIPALKRAIASGLPSCINVPVNRDAFGPGAIMFNESLKKMK